MVSPLIAIETGFHANAGIPFLYATPTAWSLQNYASREILTPAGQVRAGARHLEIRYWSAVSKVFMQ